MAKFGYVGNQPDASSVIVARQIYTATSSVGVVTFNSGYTPGYLDVYLNGVRLVDAQDFTASDGSTIILTTNTISGDVIELVAYKALSLSTSQISIQSSGTVVKDNVTALNFAGAGYTFSVVGNTVDIYKSAGIATEAIRAGIATEAIRAGMSTESTRAGIATQVDGYLGVGVTGTNLNVTGIATATQFSGDLVGTAATITTAVVGTANTLSTGGINVTGIVTATSFEGSGSGLTGLNIPAGFSELDAALFN